MLVRIGIPADLRPTIWKLLIHQQVADIKKKFGKYYFRDLCSTRGSLDETEVGSFFNFWFYANFISVHFDLILSFTLFL